MRTDYLNIEHDPFNLFQIYPYLRTLLTFDTQGLLNVISIAFEETEFNTELGKCQKQRLVDILLQVCKDRLQVQQDFSVYFECKIALNLEALIPFLNYSGDLKSDLSKSRNI